MFNTKKFLILLILLSATVIFGQNGESHSSSAQSMAMQDKMPMSDSGSHAMIKLPTIQCGMCKAKIEGALKESPGIQPIEVDVKTKMAHINYDVMKTTPAKIEEAITMLGYQANDSVADLTAYGKLPMCCKVKM